MMVFLARMPCAKAVNNERQSKRKRNAPQPFKGELARKCIDRARVPNYNSISIYAVIIRNSRQRQRLMRSSRDRYVPCDWG